MQTGVLQEKNSAASATRINSNQQKGSVSMPAVPVFQYQPILIKDFIKKDSFYTNNEIMTKNYEFIF